MHEGAGAQRRSLSSRPSSPALSHTSAASVPVNTEAALLKRRTTAGESYLPDLTANGLDAAAKHFTDQPHVQDINPPSASLSRSMSSPFLGTSDSQEAAGSQHPAKPANEPVAGASSASDSTSKPQASLVTPSYLKVERLHLGIA